MTYNGWLNRETWLVNVWYDPTTKSDIDYIEETLEDNFIEMIGGTANIYMDMIDFNCIDWESLREAMEEDEEE